MIRVSLVQRNKSKKIMTWYVRIFDTETKEIRYESLGTTKKTEAFELMCAKRADGDFDRKPENNITLGKVVDLYLKDCESRGSSPHSIACILNYINKVKPLFSKPVAAITKLELVRTFSENVKSYKPSSYNCAKTVIKTVFKFAKNTLEVIDSNPAEAIKSRKNNAKERDFWTSEQIDAIIEAATLKNDRLCFSFMAFAGLRIHEAIKVKPEDIRDGFIYVVGKGNKFAKVPISSRLKVELDRVGGSFDFSGLTESHIRRQLERIAKKALGDTFSGSANPHRLRHSFASNALRAGVGPKSLQKLLRHSNIGTTLNIYSHLIDDDLTNEIEKMCKGIDKS